MVVVDGCRWFEKTDDAGVFVDCLNFLFFFIGELFVSNFVADVEAPCVIGGTVGWWVFVDWLFVVGAGGFVVRISVFGILVVDQFVFVCGLEMCRLLFDVKVG